MKSIKCPLCGATVKTKSIEEVCECDYCGASLRSKVETQNEAVEQENKISNIKENENEKRPTVNVLVVILLMLFGGMGWIFLAIYLLSVKSQQNEWDKKHK